MITNPSQGILTSFAQLRVPSNEPSKPKGKGMMNRKGNFTKVSDNQTKPPAIVSKEIQMYINGKRKNGGINESA